MSQVWNTEAKPFDYYDDSFDVNEAEVKCDGCKSVFCWNEKESGSGDEIPICSVDCYESYYDDEVGNCGTCERELDYERDGTDTDGHRCSDCYWNEEKQGEATIAERCEDCDAELSNTEIEDNNTTDNDGNDVCLCDSCYLGE